MDGLVANQFSQMIFAYTQPTTTEMLDSEYFCFKNFTIGAFMRDFVGGPRKYLSQITFDFIHFTKSKVDPPFKFSNASGDTPIF